MITEQEAREAAERLSNANGWLGGAGATERQSENVKIVKAIRDACCDILVKFAVEELSRREAERAERALPITAEWLGAMGFVVEHDLAWHSGRVSVRQYAEQVGDTAESTILLDDNEIIWRASRRQLLDLIAALKGGAS